MIFLIGISTFSTFIPQVKSQNTTTTTYPWPMFHHDNRRTGYTESPAPNTNQTSWISQYGCHWTSPTISEGRAYVGSFNYTGAAYEDKVFFCLNETTGSLIWKYRAENNVDSSVSIYGGNVYFGSNDFYIYCLNALNGALIWKYKTGGIVRR